MRNDTMNLSERRCAARNRAAPLDLLHTSAAAEIHRVTLRPFAFVVFGVELRV
jgi:hypothetical protein